MSAVWNRPCPAQRAAPIADSDPLGIRYNRAQSGAPPKGFSHSITGGRPQRTAPPRPHREFLESQYITAPPPRRSSYAALHDSTLRPASSIYSQPDPPASDVDVNLASTYDYRYGGLAVFDVPSPTSPDSFAFQSRRSPHGAGLDISAIDEKGSEVMRPYHQGGPLGAEQADAPHNQERSDSISSMRGVQRQQSDADIREANRRQNERLMVSHPSQQPRQVVTGGKGDVRWDPMTGELTSSNRGRPSQVKPAQFAQGLDISTSPAGRLPKIPTVKNSAYGEKIQKTAQAETEHDVPTAKQPSKTDGAAGTAQTSRPGWKGASGRTILVDPVRDSRAVPPLQIPPKNNRRLQPPSATSGSPRDAAPPAQRLADSKITRPEPRKYPKPLLKGEPDAPTVTAQQLASAINTLPSQSPVSPTARLTLSDKLSSRRHAIPQESQPQSSPSAPSSHSDAVPLPTPAPRPRQTANGSLAPEKTWTQPTSHLSDTNIEAGAVDAPASSASLAQDAPAPLTNLLTKPSKDSILDRKRPIPSRGDDPGSPIGSKGNPIVVKARDTHMPPLCSSPPRATKNRASIAPESHLNALVAKARTAIGRSPSVASTGNKSLPVPPPEDEARDRVAMLNAQLQSLGNRRINLTRSIKQMTELMPTDNLMASEQVLRKRGAEKVKIEALRQELADVQRTEYELGLKLHRAYKRLDRDAEYEPTTLWVRRVTG